MKKIMTTLAVLSTSTVFAQATLEQRVDQLESLSYLEAIQWGGQFNYRYDGIKTKNGSTKNSLNPMRIGFLLDANTKADSGPVQFYSRFGLTKFVNDFQNGATREPDTFNGTREEKNINLKLERAYINYNIGKGVIFTAGRLPTIDGNPTEMWNNSARMGTYPLLSYGAVLDGIALTYNWEFSSDHKFSTRAIYTPLYSVNLDSRNPGNITTLNSSDSVSATKMSEQAPMVSVMADYETKAFSWVRNFSLIVQKVNSNQIRLRDGVPRGMTLGTVLKSPSFGGTGSSVNTTSFGSMGCVANGTGGLCDQTFEGSDLEFSLDYLSVNTIFNNIADSNVSLAVTYLSGKVKSKGYLEKNATLATSLGNTDLGRGIGIGQGFGTTSRDAKTSGSTILTTLTYATPFNAIKNPLIGFEYLKGSKEMTVFAYNTDDMTGFYATRGTAYHAFWTQPLEQGLSLRLGYQLQDHEWTKGLTGAPRATDLKEKTMYANLRYIF